MENEIGGVAGLSPMLVSFDSEASEAGIRTLTVAAQCRNLTGLSPFELGYDNQVFAMATVYPFPIRLPIAVNAYFASSSPIHLPMPR
jgi:hypothetical protein